MWVHPPLDQTLGSHWAAEYGRYSLKSREMGGASTFFYKFNFNNSQEYPVQVNPANKIMGFFSHFSFLLK